jgi:hypothetical protein
MFASNVQAANVFWMGGTGNFADPNYSDGATTNLVPQEIDVVFLGNSGTVTDSVAGIGLYQKLRVGHDMASPGGVGSATLTVNNGAQLNLTLAGGGADASVIVGGGAPATTNSGFDGTLNIDGAGSNVTSAQLVQIGFGSKSTANATVNITNGGSLVATTGNINLGERNGATGTGVPGHLNISGAASSLTISTASADLNIGVRAASSYSQTDGTVSIGDAIVVGNNAAHGSSFSLSGGTLTSKSISIGETANNVSGSITGNAVFNVTTGNFNIGLDDAQGASLLVADNADINVQNTAASTGNVFLGNATSTNTTFTMTGGTIDTGRNFLLGNATGATGIVGNQSGGTITTTLNFVVGDTNGGSTYNLSGTGAIVANGQVVVGRQTTSANSGVMNQTGGSVTAALGITVGNAQNANTALWGTGIYNVSGGTVTTNQTTGTALTIGTQGTGTFRVIGDDAVIDVNGNATVNAGGGAQGTLAYRLESGDLLSRIDVSGTATFNVGAILAFDTSLATPTQTSYELLTATDVIDNGLVFNGPAGWSFDIIAGGNGEILRAVQTGPVSVPGDYNGNGVVDAADYVLWRNGGPLQNEVNNPGTVSQEDYTEWRARFGNTSGSGSGLNAAQVPEPAVATMLLLGLVVALVRRAARR